MTIVENTPRAWDERANAPFSWQAALWSKEGQDTRFNATIEHLDLRPGDTLLDFGCGTGRLREFLPAGVGYFGLDWSLGMRERALREGGGVILKDLGASTGFDHVVAIGVFNLRHEWSIDKTVEALEDLWTRTSRTLLVSLYRGNDLACESYSLDDVAGILDVIGVEKYVVDTTYLPNDLMVVMKR